MLIQTLRSLLLMIVATSPLLALGCTTSSLTYLPVERELTSIPSPARCTQKRCMWLDLSINEEVRGSLGTQFLLFVLPFGSTHSGDIQALTFNTLFKQLVLSGYQPVLNQADGSQLPTLSVSLEDAAVTSYDLFATRLVRTKVELILQWEHSSETPVSITHSRSSYLRLPFSEALSREYRQTLQEAFEEGLGKLQLPPQKTSRLDLLG